MFSALPLTSLVYHRPHTKSIGNVAQIRDFLGRLFCSFCLLTNWLGCGIMEISRRAVVGGAPKKKSEELILAFIHSGLTAEK